MGGPGSGRKKGGVKSIVKVKGKKVIGDRGKHQRILTNLQLKQKARTTKSLHDVNKAKKYQAYINSYKSN